MDEGEYLERAKQRVREILDTEHAVVYPELEARIGEGYHRDSGLNIDPHHVLNAVKELTTAGEIIRRWDPTRSGQDVQTLQPANQHRRTTAIANAAGRKRLLYSRYLGWAHSTQRYPNGLVGPAGERAVRKALIDAGALQPAVPGFTEVSHLLGISVPGALDSAGYLVPITSHGVPGTTVTVPIEVKNLRGWLYPHAQEVYQVLHKACVLQQACPDQLIVPILICRKAHYTLYKLAKQFGFLVIEMELQFVGDVDEHSMDEVRNELHFGDIRVGEGPSLRVRDRFRDTVPLHGPPKATRWRETALNPALASLITRLKSTTKAHERDPLLINLRDVNKQAGRPGGW